MIFQLLSLELYDCSKFSPSENPWLWLRDAKEKAVRSDDQIKKVSLWQGLESGNITFSGELDFDPAELEIVYKDDDMEALR